MLTHLVLDLNLILSTQFHTLFYVGCYSIQPFNLDAFNYKQNNKQQQIFLKKRQ